MFEISGHLLYLVIMSKCIDRMAMTKSIDSDQTAPDSLADLSDCLVSGADQRGFLRGVQFNYITVLILCIFGQIGLSKQCRPRYDAAECHIWLGSKLFATHPAILHIFTGSKMDLLRRSVRKSVPNLSKISYENGILNKVGWIPLPLNLPVRIDTVIRENTFSQIELVKTD